MQIALVGGKRMKPAYDLEGICPVCKQPVISKCGNQRMHHWAHKSKVECDCWKEQETEWHRQWKKKFPEDWQEIVHYDDTTNEKHISDVKTKGNMVIEFQHSHIDPKERQSREAFYKKMVWVVNGTRLKNDLVRFEKARKHFKKYEHSQNLITVENYEKVFPRDWLSSKVPVFIDFLGMKEVDDSWKDNLICVFPERVNGKIIFCFFKRSAFIQKCEKDELFYLLFRLFLPISQSFAKKQNVKRRFYSPPLMVNIENRSPKMINKLKREGYNVRF